MIEDKKQFDSTVGGTQDLPPSLHLAKFAACRSQEIQIMKNYLTTQTGTKLAFQTLPKHMRRRAMSHNVKRLPRRLRQIHLNQMKKSGMPTKQKRPSRKYRRRPKNLLEEYTRRSNKKYRWLQTHIWHAKRFHMIEKWGYKIACHPRDKAFRACYRATTRHCLLQDISYVKCIEISGDKHFIVNSLKKMCEANTGLGFGAKAYISGNREGEIFLFDSNTRKPIGAVNFFWQPFESDGVSKLWLWVHPAFYTEILESLVNLFDLTLENDCYCNECSTITITELRDLCRLRLTGPLSNAILQDAFTLLEESKINTMSNVTWLREYLEMSDSNKELIKTQNEFWKSIVNVSSPSELPPHMILSLVVADPRLNIPQKRVKCVPDTSERKYFDEIKVEYNQSPMWFGDLRKRFSEKQLSNAKINEIRSKLLVPGSPLEQYSNYLPILLVQRPGCKSENVGYSSGWDVILTSEWVKPFWISFVMRSARVGGLRESKSISYEMGKSQFLPPDTKAGVQEENQTTKECIAKFFRKPPNKRTNYNKFKIASPFCCSWKLLIQDWKAEPVNEFVVLRNRILLLDVQRLLSAKGLFEIPKLPENCLIPVKLVYEQKGTPAQFAIICLSKEKSDIKKNVFESNAVDQYEVERKETRKAHKVLLKKLRKRRKLKNHHVNNDDAHKEVLANYTKKMRALWLPEAKNVRDSCSREVIGFVQKGAFSFSLGKSSATGYIAADALPALTKSPYKNKVLVRNTNSKLYRAANLSVIVD